MDRGGTEDGDPCRPLGPKDWGNEVEIDHAATKHWLAEECVLLSEAEVAKRKLEHQPKRKGRKTK